jgi:hypothetical protein
MQEQDLPIAVAYVRAGLALVSIPLGKKGPRTSGWDLEPGAIRTEAIAAKLNGHNVGLAHLWSGTCVLDVDDSRLAIPWLTARGIDLLALLAADNAVQIESGRKYRGKLLYRLPPGIKWLPTRQPPGAGLELRCATSDGSKTVQDVLPPSVIRRQVNPIRGPVPGTGAGYRCYRTHSLPSGKGSVQDPWSTSRAQHPPASCLSTPRTARPRTATTTCQAGLLDPNHHTLRRRPSGSRRR